MNMFLFTLTVFIMLLCLHILTLNMYSGKQNLYSISRRTKLSYFLLLLYFFVLFLMNVISLQHNWQYKVSPTRRRKNKCSYFDFKSWCICTFLFGWSVFSPFIFSIQCIQSKWTHGLITIFASAVFVLFHMWVTSIVNSSTSLLLHRFLKYFEDCKTNWVCLKY